MHIDPVVKRAFSDGVSFVAAQISGVRVKKTHRIVDELSKNLPVGIQRFYKDPKIESYRRFIWSTKLNPELHLPRLERIIREGFRGNNTVMDCCDIASVNHLMAIAPFSYRKVTGKLVVRFAREEGKYLDKKLGKRNVVLSDSNEILCVYPYLLPNPEYRVNGRTREIVVVGFGVPGIDPDELSDAVEDAMQLIQRTSGGKYMGSICVN
jgi:DNA/RNA-binding domain of Phe-tRNA-synthetase-like protein